MQIISLWPYLIYIGCFAATLSTALTALIAVPKILQKMGEDDIYPFLKYLAKGYGKSNEPFRAHFLAIIISSIFLCIGKIDLIIILIYILRLFIEQSCASKRFQFIEYLLLLQAN